MGACLWGETLMESKQHPGRCKDFGQFPRVQCCSQGSRISPGMTLCPRGAQSWGVGQSSSVHTAAEGLGHRRGRGGASGECQPRRGDCAGPAAGVRGRPVGSQPSRGAGVSGRCWRWGPGRTGAPEKGSHFIGSASSSRFYFSF